MIDTASLDLTNVKIGDIVIVRHAILDVDRNDSQNPIRVSDGEWPDVKQIVAVESGPLQVGSQVRVAGSITGTIVYIKGVDAVVDEGESLGIYEVSTLDRI